MEADVRKRFEDIDLVPGNIRFLAELCFAGQDSALTIDFEEIDELPAKFEDAYLSIFGYQPPDDRRVEVVSMRAVAARSTRRRIRFSSSFDRFE